MGYKSAEKKRDYNRRYYQTHRTDLLDQAKGKYPTIKGTKRQYLQNYHRMRKYGMSPEDYARLLSLQGGQCAICQRSTKLVIDHCHKSKKVRGLLCNSCNGALGHVEKVVWLSSAIRYLQAQV